MLKCLSCHSRVKSFVPFIWISLKGCLEVSLKHWLREKLEFTLNQYLNNTLKYPFKVPKSVTNNISRITMLYP